MLLFKKTQIYLYFFVYFALLAIFYQFPPTSFFLMFSFLFFISLPGFSLGRLLKIELKNDSLGQFVIWLTLGLTFAFLVSFLGILLKLTLGQLVVIYEISIFILFVSAFALDYFRESKFNFNLKVFFIKENLVFIPVFIVIILTLNAVDLQGANFRGDPNFHLSIMRKAVEGLPLSIENLSYVRHQVHAAYAFPVWHVFLSMLGKITNVSIFNIWIEIIVPLMIFSFLVWYWLFKNIFSNKIMTVLAFLSFVLVTFYWDHGYLFTRLPVPDTLAQIVLLPLLLSLAIKYLTDVAVNYKVLFLMVLLAMFTLIIHATQFFYFALVITLFAMLHLIVNFKNDNFKIYLKKAIFFAVSMAAYILPLYLLYKTSSEAVTNTLSSFSKTVVLPRYGTYKRMLVEGKYSYALLPLVLLFISKNKKMVFFIALFMVAPILYGIEPVKFLFSKYLGMIFMNRLYGNLTWSFVIWPLVAGLIILFVNYLLSNVNKYIRYVFNMTIVSMVMLFTYLSFTEHLFYKSHMALFSPAVDGFFNFYGKIVTLMLFLAVLLIIILMRRKNILLDFANAKEIVATTSIITIFALFFMARDTSFLVKYAGKQIQSKHFFRELPDQRSKLVAVKQSGLEMFDYIKQNVPVKSTFITDSSYLKLPLVLDQHMATYPGNSEKQFISLWNGSKNLQSNLKLLNSKRVEYILLSKSDSDSSFFDKNPKYFKKLFANEHRLYQVNLKNVEEDYAGLK